MTTKSYAFDFANIKRTETLDEFVQRARETERRECGPIDKRIVELENDFQRLVKELKVLDRTHSQTTGFWKRLSISSEARETAKRIAIVRDLLEELYRARKSRTYG